MNNDLISRETLKNALNYIYDCAYIDSKSKEGIASDIIAEIDNAPTVPERDYSQGWHDAITKALNEAYTFTTDDGTFKVVQVETLEGLGMSIPKRPKGEWKTVEGYDGDEYYECSNCGEPWVLMAGTPKNNNMNFCPNCGADMRKGGAE